MNQIIKNVERVIEKYGKHANTDNKLVLLYLREYGEVRWDNKIVSTRDFLNIDMKIIQEIIDAKYLLELMEDSK